MALKDCASAVLLAALIIAMSASCALLLSSSDDGLDVWKGLVSALEKHKSSFDFKIKVCRYDICANRSVIIHAKCKHDVCDKKTTEDLTKDFDKLKINASNYVKNVMCSCENKSCNCTIEFNRVLSSVRVDKTVLIFVVRSEERPSVSRSDVPGLSRYHIRFSSEIPESLIVLRSDQLVRCTRTRMTSAVRLDGYTVEVYNVVERTTLFICGVSSPEHLWVSSVLITAALAIAITSLIIVLLRLRGALTGGRGL